MKSLQIILDQFKKEHISEEEAIIMIEELYKNKNYQPFIPPTWQGENIKPYEYKITCSQ